MLERQPLPRRTATPDDGREASPQLSGPMYATGREDRRASVGRAVDPITRLVNATLRAENSDALIPGMSLSVRIMLPEQSGVVVPRAAILEDAEGLHVFIIRDGVARRRPVELAFETDTEALVKAGIASGDKVAISGVAVLHDGVAVREPKS